MARRVAMTQATRFSQISPPGYAALTALLTDPNYVHDTVGQAINSYLGHPSTNPLSKGNNASLYIQDVCEWCDAAPTTPIADLLG